METTWTAVRSSTAARLAIGAVALVALWVAPMWALACYGAIVGLVQIARFTAQD